ncbi:NUDIX domain-containing protein [Alloscardovia macacae]|uniref:DNA mismatch repair protein MutT n=1 Tax=Alloscardovia macacae TaxID=1160091 RepID=A0A261F6E1_9BIFI|nr:NUDIX hydrolase [Alloscardovia macacae]OZG54654.1 DNA mismatch repair protein MutT [Alloscardovia macacae]
MKNISIEANEPVDPSRFLHFYKVSVGLDNGSTARYDVVTRKPAASLEDLDRGEGDAVTIIARSLEGDRMLLIHEYRPAINGYVWAFPAGLIDPDDSSFEAAAERELAEETGYRVVRVDDVLRPTYVSPGMTNESIAFVYMTVDAGQTDVQQHLEESEDITVRWVTRDEARALLRGAEAIDQRMALVLHEFIS